MSEKSKRYDQLAADIRGFKARLTALGISKEFTNDLDGYASQVESFSAELNETSEVVVDNAELPIGKTSPSGPVLTGGAATQVPDAQTQLETQKSLDASKTPAAPAATTGKTTAEPVKP